MTLVLIASQPNGTLQDQAGNANSGGAKGTAEFRNRDGTAPNHFDGTLVTHYADASATGPLTTPIVADSRGRLMRFIAAGHYRQIVNGESIDFHATPGSVESRVGHLDRLPTIDLTTGRYNLSDGDDITAEALDAITRYAPIANQQGLIIKLPGDFEISGQVIFPAYMRPLGEGKRTATRVKCTTADSQFGIRSRGGYSGRFTIDANNIATLPLYIDAVDSKLDDMEVRNSADVGAVIENAQNSELDIAFDHIAGSAIIWKNGASNNKLYTRMSNVGGWFHEVVQEVAQGAAYPNGLSGQILAQSCVYNRILQGSIMERLGFAVGTCTTVNGSSQISAVGIASGESPITDYRIGHYISGAGIPAGTKIGTVGATTINLVDGSGTPVNATASASNVPILTGNSSAPGKGGIRSRGGETHFDDVVFSVYGYNDGNERPVVAMIDYDGQSTSNRVVVKGSRSQGINRVGEIGVKSDASFAHRVLLVDHKWQSGANMTVYKLADTTLVETVARIDYNPTSMPRFANNGGTKPYQSLVTQLRTEVVEHALQNDTDDVRRIRMPDNSGWALLDKATGIRRRAIPGSASFTEANLVADEIVVGSPEGVLARPPGSLVQDSGGNFYLKVTGTGNTGWRVIPVSATFGHPEGFFGLSSPAFFTTTLALVSGTWYAGRFTPPINFTLIGIGFRVSTASGTDDPVEGTVHDSSGTRLATSGSTTGKLNSTGLKSVALSQAMIAGNSYEIGLVGTSTATLAAFGLNNSLGARFFGDSLGQIDAISIAAWGIGNAASLTGQAAAGTIPGLTPLK